MCPTEQLFLLRQNSRQGCVFCSLNLLDSAGSSIAGSGCVGDCPDCNGGGDWCRDGTTNLWPPGECRMGRWEYTDFDAWGFPEETFLMGFHGREVFFSVPFL